MPTDASILADVRDFRQESSAVWDEIIDEARTDMKYVSGDPWDEDDKAKRKAAGRPCLTLDELNQYFNQGINDLRANPLGMKFSPRGNGASEKGAEFYQNKAREIEYRSRAQIAYITAAENMFQQGVGWVKVGTRYRDESSWEQDIWIEPVMNPLNILPDPHSIWPDSRDTKRLIEIETYAIPDFKRAFPDAQVTDFTREDRQLAPQWLREGKVDVGAFWVKQETKKTLLLLTADGADTLPPISIFKDALEAQGGIPKGYKQTKERESETCKVVQYITNGVEILATKPWAGTHIPFVSFFGKVLWLDGTRVILSQTRLARDPYLAYCFYRTCEMENIGLTTKNPYWAYKDQVDDDMMQQVAKSLHEPVAMLLASHTVPGLDSSTVLPLPQRNQFNAQIESSSVAAEEMRRAIQSAMGVMPLPTQAQRQNEKSGEALKRLEASAQKGSFHFVDHYKDGVTRVGEIVENLIDKIHDTAGETWVREADGSDKAVPINDPQNPEAYQTKGDYVCTISAGPSFESQRDAAETFVDGLLSNLKTIAELRGPAVAAEILSQSIKLKQLGPIGDGIADLLEPPEFKQQDGEPVSPEMAQARAMIKQLQGQLQQAMTEIKTEQAKTKAELDAKVAIEQAKGQVDLQKAQIDAQSKREELQAKLDADLKKIQVQTDADLLKAAADRETKLAVAELTAKAERENLFLEERSRLGLESVKQTHAETAAERQREHERTLAAQQLSAEAEQKAQDRAVTRETAAAKAGKIKRTVSRDASGLIDSLTEEPVQ